MLSAQSKISTIDILIKFCRNLKTKDDLVTAKELLEYADYFTREADKLVELHQKELSTIIELAKRIRARKANAG